MMSKDQEKPKPQEARDQEVKQPPKPQSEYKFTDWAMI